MDPETAKPDAPNSAANGGEGGSAAAAKKKKKKRNRKKKGAGGNANAATAESGDETSPPLGATESKDSVQSTGDGAEVMTPANGQAKNNNNNNKNRNKKNNQNKNGTSLPADLEKIKKLEEELKTLQESKLAATGSSDVETVQKLQAELKTTQDENESLKAKNATLEANLVAAEKAKNEERIALKDEIQALKSKCDLLEKEKEATEMALSQMKSMEQMPPVDLSKKELKKELDSVKENFVKDRAQLEQNLQLAHDVQMQEAKKKQDSLEQELLHTQQELKLSLQRMQELAAASQENSSRAAPAAAAGDDVAKVWQDKCVAKAKELKDTQKLLKAMENDKNELEAQLEKVVVEKKPWWLCG